MNKLISEWAPQACILLTWPHEYTDFAPILKDVEKDYLAIAKAISQFEPLVILCYDQLHYAHVKNLLKKEKLAVDESIHLAIVPTNDVWIRDYGPLSVVNTHHELSFFNFIFNAWGSKYECRDDEMATERLIKTSALPQRSYQKINFILEGGSIDVDDDGNLLTTTRCLITDTRNGTQDKTAVSAKLKEYLGVQQILWLTEGELAGDDTDSHIDNLARFSPNQIIFHTTCDDSSDPHYLPLKMMEDELRTYCQQYSLPYTLQPLPIPSAIFNADQQRLPASYANFLIINDAVLVPIYGDKRADEYALQHITLGFPGRRIVPVSCRHLIEQYGSLHCATMQISLSA